VGCELSCCEETRAELHSILQSSTIRSVEEGRSFFPPLSLSLSLSCIHTHTPLSGPLLPDHGSHMTLSRDPFPMHPSILTPLVLVHREVYSPDEVAREVG